MRNEPEGLAAFLAECERASGADPRFDAHLAATRDRLATLAAGDPEWLARRVVEDLAIALQASLLLRNAPPFVAEAFCAGRLGEGGRAFGTLPSGVDADAIVERALAL
jgi:putative acyl-CoA dehydrogenase